MVLGAVMNTFLVQYLLLDAEDFSKTKDMKLFLNVLVCLSLYLLIYACSTSVLASCMSSYIFWCILGFVNYYVYFFRQNEFYFADLRSVGTGLSVAGQYAISLSDKGCYVILAGILYLVLVCRIKTEIAVRWQASLLGLLGMIGCMLLVGIESADVNTETWEQKGTYRNGYFLNFVLSARDSYVGKPEDYSVEELTELEAKYLKKQPKMSSTKVAGAMSDASGVANGSVQDPAIIVIMNESFADLETIGPLDTNEEVMPFYDSLQENTVKGYALSSVFGAKTPNSEWEFLAGGSMAFLPGGSVVYQQYLDDQPVTLVNVLQSMDYTCVSMHPYYATGWSRNLVYPNIGFDESYFIEDFDRKDLCREYITDEEVYRKVIERYENRQVNEKLFIMGITMQNHGGYTTTYENFPEPVYKLGPSYTDANQYLSLVRKSDDALSEFIAYFREVEEPVVVVFFGDHQPSLSKEFYPILNGKGTTGLSEEEMQK